MATETKQIDDGGPAMLCRRCSSQIKEPKLWQRRDGRCMACKRKEQNARNASDPDGVRIRARQRYAANREYWVDYRKARSSDPDFLLKRKARRKVATEIEAGRLVRGRCALCGSEKVDAHHHDYKKPLDVTWLCRSCHIRIEKGAGHAEAI